jgi:hypothetical protein
VSNNVMYNEVSPQYNTAIQVAINVIIWLLHIKLLLLEFI